MTDALEIDPVPEPRAGWGTVELWRGSDRLWRYRFPHPEGLVIRSNRSFVTREQAVDSAALAYLGVPIVDLAKPPDSGPPAHPWRKLARVTIFTGGLGLVIVGVAKLLLFLRRLARRGKQLAEWIGIAADLSRRNR